MSGPNYDDGATPRVQVIVTKTLRDEFAALAINGMLSADPNVLDSVTTVNPARVHQLACAAYLIADAMMEARK